MQTETKLEILSRLQCLEGHIRGVKRMVDGDADCRQILHQTKALEGALHKVRCLMLQEYLRIHLPQAILAVDDEDRDQFLGEFSGLIIDMDLKIRP